MTIDTTDAGAPAAVGTAPRSSDRAQLLRHAAPGLVVLAVGPALLWGYRYHVGLDGVAYLSIAQQYAEGQIRDAVNGYWSPLLSWLSVPALAAGLAPIVSGHLVLVVAAAVAVVGIGRVGRTLASETAGELAALTAVPFALAAVTYGVFAEIVVAALLLHLVGVLLSPRYPRTWGAAVEAGAWGGAAYLAKVVALPVVVIAVVLIVALRWNEVDQRRRIVRSAATTLAVVAVTVAAWSAVLTWRYGEPTLSTSAGYNAAVVAPGSRGNPIHYAGLLPPPTPNAVSAWDDPAQLPVDAPQWRQATPQGNLSRLVGNVAHSLRAGAAALLDDAPVLFLAIIAGAVVGGVRSTTRRPTLLILGVTGAYTAAHLLTWLEPRYLWPPVLVATSLVAVLLGRLPHRTRLVVWAVLAVAVAVPVIDGVALRWNAGEETRAVARLLAEHDVEGRNVASANNYQRGAVLCLHAGCRYYGTAARNGTPLDEQLAEHDIDVYLVELPVADDTPVPRDLEPAARYGDTLVYEIPAPRYAATTRSATSSQLRPSAHRLAALPNSPRRTSSPRRSPTARSSPS